MIDQKCKIGKAILQIQCNCESKSDCMYNTLLLRAVLVLVRIFMAAVYLCKLVLYITIACMKIQQYYRYVHT